MFSISVSDQITKIICWNTFYPVGLIVHPQFSELHKPVGQILGLSKLKELKSPLFFTFVLNYLFILAVGQSYSFSIEINTLLSFKQYIYFFLYISTFHLFQSFLYLLMLWTECFPKIHIKSLPPHP